MREIEIEAECVQIENGSWPRETGLKAYEISKKTKSPSIVIFYKGEEGVLFKFMSDRGSYKCLPIGVVGQESFGTIYNLDFRIVGASNEKEVIERMTSKGWWREEFIPLIK